MKIYFVTGNRYKSEEISSYFKAEDIGRKHNLELLVVEKTLQEILHPDIDVIVKAKALEAYKYLGVPCVVEHGGIFINSLKNLPGGIGQIIWDAVGDRLCSFIKDNEPRHAIARSILGYCDGKKIHTYIGETEGEITMMAKGKYQFNWDPIFIPSGSAQTYGEMGPLMKQNTSQSIKAWKQFFDDISRYAETHTEL